LFVNLFFGAHTLIWYKFVMTNATVRYSVTINHESFHIKRGHTIIICILAPAARCLMMTSFRKIISVNFIVRSSSLLIPYMINISLSYHYHIIIISLSYH
jgi:hypothetical protein